MGRKKVIAFLLALQMALICVLQSFALVAGAVSTTAGEDEYVSIHQYVTPTDDESIYKITYDISVKLNPGATLVTFVLDNSESMDFVNVGNGNRDVKYDATINGTSVGLTGDIWDGATGTFITRRQAVVKSVEAAINVLKQKNKGKEFIFVNIVGTGDITQHPATTGTMEFSKNAAVANATGMGHFEGFIPLFDVDGTTVNPDVQKAIDDYLAFELNAGDVFLGERMSVISGATDIVYDSMRDILLKINDNSVAPWVGGSVDRLDAELVVKRTARYVMMLSDGDTGYKTLEGLDDLAALKYPSQYDEDGNILDSVDSGLGASIYGKDYPLGATVWSTVFGSDGMHLVNPVDTLATYKNSADFTNASGWEPVVATGVPPGPVSSMGFSPVHSAVEAQKTPTSWPSTIRTSIEYTADFDAMEKAIAGGAASAGAGQGELTPYYDSYRTVEPYMILASSEVDRPLSSFSALAAPSTPWALADDVSYTTHVRWLYNMVLGTYTWEPHHGLDSVASSAAFISHLNITYPKDGPNFASDFRKAVRTMPSSPSNGYDHSDNVHYFWIQHINGITPAVNTSTRKPNLEYGDNSELGYMPLLLATQYNRQLQHPTMTNQDRVNYGSMDGIEVFKQFSIAAVNPLVQESANVTISDAFNLATYKNHPMIKISASDGTDPGSFTRSGKNYIEWTLPDMEDGITYKLEFFVKINDKAMLDTDLYYSVSTLTFVVDGVTLASQEVFINPSTGESKAGEGAAQGGSASGSAEGTTVSNPSGAEGHQANRQAAADTRNYTGPGMGDAVPGIKEIKSGTSSVSGKTTVSVNVENGSWMLYQWQYRDENGEWSNIFGAISSQHTITPNKTFVKGEEYELRCRITNRNGRAFYSDSIKVTVAGGKAAEGLQTSASK